MTLFMGHSRPLSRLSSYFAEKLLPPLWPLLMGLIGLEGLVRLRLIPAFLVAPPSAVCMVLLDEAADFSRAFFSTALCALLGLLASFIIGTVLAVVLSLSRALRRSFYPYAIFFQTVPIIAIAPLLVIWFGFGQPTVVACSFIVSLFPVVASTLLGLDSTDPGLVDLFSLYSASRFDFLWKLRLPFALPQMFSGLRIAAGLAVIGALVGEFIAGGGLGELIDAARTQQRIDKVFAAVFLSSVLGLAIMSSINFVSFLALRRWHVSMRNR